MVGLAALGEVVVRVGVGAETEFDFGIGTYLVFDGGGAAEVGAAALAAALAAVLAAVLQPLGSKIPMDVRPLYLVRCLD